MFELSERAPVAATYRRHSSQPIRAVIRQRENFFPFRRGDVERYRQNFQERRGRPVQRFVHIPAAQNRRDFFSRLHVKAVDVFAVDEIIRVRQKFLRGVGLNVVAEILRFKVNN